MASQNLSHRVIPPVEQPPGNLFHIPFHIFHGFSVSHQPDLASPAVSS